MDWMQMVCLMEAMDQVTMTNKMEDCNVLRNAATLEDESQRKI